MLCNWGLFIFGSRKICYKVNVWWMKNVSLWCSPPLSKLLEEMRFRVIRYKFDKIPVHDLCYLLLCGWLQVLSNVKIASREAFWDHSQSIWWIFGQSIFSPPTLGVAEGCRAWESLYGRCFGLILNRFDGFSNHRVFLPSTLGVAEGGSLRRAWESICGSCFGIILNRSDGFLDYWFFSPPNFGGGCRG